MTMHSPEERKAFKALDRLTAAVVLQSESTEKLALAAERQADALEKIEGHLTGVINVIDTLDTTLGHGIAAIVAEM